eukprot:scaffold44492_cov18-Tisochrysis_lutea.AAC.2
MLCHRSRCFCPKGTLYVEKCKGTYLAFLHIQKLRLRSWRYSPPSWGPRSKLILAQQFNSLSLLICSETEILLNETVALIGPTRGPTYCQDCLSSFGARTQTCMADLTFKRVSAVFVAKYIRSCFNPFFPFQGEYQWRCVSAECPLLGGPGAGEAYVSSVVKELTPSDLVGRVGPGAEL